MRESVRIRFGLLHIIFLTLFVSGCFPFPLSEAPSCDRLARSLNTGIFKCSDKFKDPLPPAFDTETFLTGLRENAPEIDKALSGYVLSVLRLDAGYVVGIQRVQGGKILVYDFSETLDAIEGVPCDSSTFFSLEEVCRQQGKRVPR